MTTYVYGIARDERADPAGPAEPEPHELPEGLTGVGDPPRPVRVVGGGGLTAVVSDCPDRLRPKRRDLLAHQRVLAEVGRWSTVLPMRFGSVSDSDEKVRAVLAEHAERYREQLDRLTGRVEYNVKAVHREEVVLHLVLAGNAELRALAAANRASGGGSYEERLRFGELVAHGVREREVRDAALVEDSLRPLAEECRPGPESAGWFVNLSFLLTRPAAERLLTTAAGLEKAHPQLDLKVHGPLPPYSFVTP
ncbi:gas vesicle synthesis protein GvpLGvpF [Streptomyces albireticuli]|uniref:Gas vesicle synthesis protein GvpLGvpF n=1 Tax=Streptomyces albireticuli TaxID=1940 RepID=A0A1Z2L978_9ACTN|nr:GvpL/GvpF family gas vesicle protein [Streptomyces albireticuli]ARZ70847.1 gas vesicle synthesis protein GvpLGvpF [Streptomyces albireticuli]